MTAPAHHEPDRNDRGPGDGPRSLLRRLLRRGLSPEERVAALIAAHREDLEQQRARFEQTVDDLERREQLLSDAKASVERLLRLGSRDLDAREADVARLITELTDREQRLRGQEAELARRRGETGAVELRRLRVEQQERTLAERERALAERETSSGASRATVDAGETAEAPPRLAFVPGAGYRLVELDDVVPVSERTLVLDGEQYEIARIGPSPLPADDRRCAYLVRGRRPGPSGGSS